jgi:thioredoxin reductase
MRDYDVVVVGGGAAGLSAALVLVRARRAVAVVDAGAPRNAPAAHMHGFLSRDGTPPHDLLAAGRSEVTGYGGHLLDDTVVGVEPGFHVRLASGSSLRARRILVATGLRDELPEVPTSGSDGDGTCSTARTAMAGRSATSRSGCSGARRRPSSTRCWCASGRPT